MKWHTIAKFPLYEVSDQGQVRRATSGQGTRTGSVLRPRPTHDGYLRVTLYDGSGKPKDKYIHCLVLEAFLGVVPEGCEGNHIDGNKANNRLGNLEYVTHAENVRHSKHILGVGFCPPLVQGEAHYKAKLREDDVRDIRRRVDQGESPSEVAKLFSISYSNVWYIVTRRTWKHVS